jgi:hypothetical protein
MIVVVILHSTKHAMDYGGSVQCAEEFLAHGADTNTTNNEGKTALVLDVAHHEENPQSTIVEL